MGSKGVKGEIQDLISAFRSIQTVSKCTQMLVLEYTSIINGYWIVNDEADLKHSTFLYPKLFHFGVVIVAWRKQI